MIAVDTNILVRLLTRDDPMQVAAVDSLFSAETIWIAKTVLLESAWVLGGRYGFEGAAFVGAVESLLGLENVIVEDESAVVAALALISHGIGAADAMHLSFRPAGATFVSFDRALVRRAQRAGIKDVELAG